MTSAARAERRLHYLYDISKLLTSYEGIEPTLSAVVARAACCLPVRTATLLVETRAGLRSQVWKTEDVDEREAHGALDRARTHYRWFRGQKGRVEETSSPVIRPLVAAADTANAYAPSDANGRPTVVVLPLVVRRGEVFGVLQVESAAMLDEGDVFFVNAVANQAAVAIDRQATIDESDARVRAQLDFTRAIAGSLGEGVIAVDLDERITFVNRAAESFLGVTEADALQQPASKWLRVQRDDGQPVASDNLPFAVARRVRRRVACDDYSFVGRDGMAVPVSYTAAPILSGSEIWGAVLVFRDLLAAKRSARMQRILADVSAALAESLDYRAMLTALVRCAVPSFADSCFIDEIGQDGKVSRNEMAFSASEETSTLSEKLRRFVPKPGWQTPQASALATGKSFLFDQISEDELAGLDDDEVYAEALRPAGMTSAIVAPIVLEGRCFGVLTFAMGKSGRRYTEDDLAFAEQIALRTATAIGHARLHDLTEKAARARQDTLAIVSHDLRSPLNTLFLALGPLLDWPAEHERRHADRRLLQIIGRAADRMARMTTDLLDVASIEAGHLAIDAHPTPVGVIVDDVVESMDAAASTKSLELVVRHVDRDALVLSDRDRMLQVLTNIVTNAIKFTPEGGRIELSAESGDAFVRFCVTDTGTGISSDLLPHVFERYRQAAETASHGRGLGLFIAKGIVEAHGGTIAVHSQEGKGTTFVIELPRDRSDLRQGKMATASPRRGRSHGAPSRARALARRGRRAAAT